MILPGNDKLATTAAEFMDKLEDELRDANEPRLVGVGIAAEVRYRLPDEDFDRTEVICMCSEDSRVWQRGLFDEAYDRAVNGDRAPEEGDED